MAHTIKRCLILSDGPVPVPEHDKVEGGGLRCWGLANGIKANNVNIEVTVAYNEAYKKEKFTHNFQDINIATWNETSVAALVKEYDSVIVSYCMGNLSIAVAEAVNPEQQLVLDCYVPIYVEMSARKSSDIEGEYKAFNFELDRWAAVLRRGDLFLCANDAQKSFYEGVLGAVGRINPITYGEELIRVVPYGIYEEKPVPKSKPLQKLLTDKKALKVLWFGGIYPWFDLTNLIDAVKTCNESTPTELVIVGAKNPFNTHPDFVRKYTDLVEYIDTNDLSPIVHIADWVNFNDRGDWYLDSDIVVVVNEEGPENKLAWRTRLVDFVWADLPILTNAGDPLGEMLVAHKAAIRLDALSSHAIASKITEITSKPDLLKEAKRNIAQFRTKLLWPVVTQQLTKDIQNHTRALDLTTKVSKIKIDNSKRTKSAKIRSAVYNLPRYYRQYGARATVLTVGTKVRTIVDRKTGKNKTRDPKLIVLSHQLDLSGAPYVLLDLVSEIIKDPDMRKRLDFRTFNPVAKQNLKTLNTMGITPSIYLDKNGHFTFVDGDVVLLNSFAFSPSLVKSLLDAVDEGTVKKVVWYGHEATPKGFVHPAESKRIKRLLKADKLKIYALADNCQQVYISYFGTDTNIDKLPYRLDIPQEDFRQLREKDFEKLTFVLPGTVSDGRKGQMPVLYAFIDFYNRFYLGNEHLYRDFNLTMVGLGNDFLSEQIRRSGNSMGKHFTHHSKVSRDTNLAITRSANVTICYSLQEALPLFVYEGMAYGHPLLRNDCSGYKEQLIDGVNGYALSSDDYDGLVTSIERMLNKSTTSSKLLASMSAKSVEIASQACDKNYDLLIDALKK
jgi:glycosyltransferase involved in cell wall biosynthesis